MAAMKIDNEHLVGKILPNVYINNITLISRGDVEEKSDPHVHLADEVESYRDEYGRLVWAPQPTPNSIRRSPKRLMVVLNISMKEIFEDNIIGHWFGNQELMKYFSIIVIQCISTEEFNNVSSLLLSRNISGISNLRIDKKIIHVQSAINTRLRITGEDIKKFYTTTEPNGDRIIDIPFKETFMLENSTPEHLSYFLIPTFNMEQLITDFDLDISARIRNQVAGNPVSEIVIDNSRVLSVSVIFVTNNGELWTGPVFKNRKTGGWYGVGGTRDEPTTITLNRQMVPNSKIQDFRNFDEIKKLQFNFQELKHKSEKLLNKKFDTNLVLPRASIFSNEIRKSQTEFGQFLFDFDIDFKSLFENETLHGKLISSFENGNLLLEILSKSIIRSMKIFRYRVKKNPYYESGTNSREYIEFDKNEAPQLIVSSGERRWGRFVSVNRRIDSDGDGVADMRIGSIREIDLRENGIIRRFAVVDESAKYLTAGLYQYEIEIIVEDGIFHTVVEQLQDLRRAIVLLNKYYKLALIPNRDTSTGKIVFGNFDVESNRFTQKFINEQTSIYRNNLQNAPWVAPLAIFKTILEMFSDGSSGEIENILDLLGIFINPNTGNPDGILKTIEVIENLADKIQMFLGSKTIFISISEKDASSNQQLSKTRSQQTKTSFLKHRFKEIFDADYPRSFGVNFIQAPRLETINVDVAESNVQNVNRFGRVTYSMRDYRRRAELESLKYFNAVDKPIDLVTEHKVYSTNDRVQNTQYSYFSPSYINVPNLPTLNVLEKGGETFESNRYNGFLVAATQYMKNREVKPIDDLSSMQTTMHNLYSSLTSLAADRGIVIQTSTTDDIFDQVDALLRNARLLESDFTFGSDNAEKQEELFRIKQEIGEVANTINSVSLGLTMGKTKSKKANMVFHKDFFNMYSKENGIDKMKLNKDSIKNMPNQIKSLLLASTGKADIVKNNSLLNKTKKTEEKLAFEVNYSMLAKVEVFDGFERDRFGKPLINKPIWSLLTNDKMNEKQGQELNCRVSYYNDSNLGIGVNQDLKFPIINEHFTILPETEQQKPKAKNKNAKMVENLKKIVKTDNKLSKIKTEAITTNKMIKRF